MKIAIIVAGGTSTRYGHDKLGEQLLGKSVLQHSVDVFRSIADQVIVVGQHVDETFFAEGGSTRFQSVLNGFNLISDDCDGVVAIHDGARPFVTRQFVGNLYAEAEKYGSAVPCLQQTDTVYQLNGDIFTKLDRSTVFTVQTPQVFEISKLRSAINLAVECNKLDYTDESTLYYEAHGVVHFVEGLRSNKKITFQDDLPQYKVGVGFDVHPFAEGDGVILGGVTIPFDKKLKGHSDADALCHAICDAILSASGNKDIGHQFPDTDERYKGADSTKLLEQCVQLAAQSGFEIVNVSAVVICQAPKIAPHIDKMAQRLSPILAIPCHDISISATTTEHLGALGNGDGIAVSAEVLLKRI